MPVSLASAGGALWVFNQGDNTASVVDSRTLQVLRSTLGLNESPNGIASLDGYLWVTESGADEAAVIRPS